jgi:hypothetical protein
MTPDAKTHDSPANTEDVSKHEDPKHPKIPEGILKEEKPKHPTIPEDILKEENAKHPTIPEDILKHEDPTLKKVDNKMLSPAAAPLNHENVTHSKLEVTLTNHGTSPDSKNLDPTHSKLEELMKQEMSKITTADQLKSGNPNSPKSDPSKPTNPDPLKSLLSVHEVPKTDPKTDPKSLDALALALANHPITHDSAKPEPVTLESPNPIPEPIKPNKLEATKLVAEKLDVEKPVPDKVVNEENQDNADWEISDSEISDADESDSDDSETPSLMSERVQLEKKDSEKRSLEYDSKEKLFV